MYDICILLAKKPKPKNPNNKTTVQDDKTNVDTNKVNKPIVKKEFKPNQLFN